VNGRSWHFISSPFDRVGGKSWFVLGIHLQTTPMVSMYNLPLSTNFAQVSHSLKGAQTQLPIGLVGCVPASSTAAIMVFLIPQLPTFPVMSLLPSSVPFRNTDVSLLRHILPPASQIPLLRASIYSSSCTSMTVFFHLRAWTLRLNRMSISRYDRCFISGSQIHAMTEQTKAVPAQT